MDVTTGSSLLFGQLTQAGCARIIYYGEKNEINYGKLEKISNRK